MTTAIVLVGLQPLAKAVGVSYQAIRKFERETIPGERVIAVAMATDWRVTPHQLRPDIYPNPADALPAGYDPSPNPSPRPDSGPGAKSAAGPAATPSAAPIPAGAVGTGIEPMTQGVA